ncbi:MAG: SDR family oxidoreductase [Phycisphaerae bacterium]|jgi:UDP-glucose 4-epimerase
MSVHLVTGGAGFIGSHIVRSLVADGLRVRVLDDFSTGRRRNLADVAQRVEVIEGSICDPAAVKSAMRGVETVFHLAARSSVPRSVEQPAETNEVNVNGTLNLLLAARDAGVRRFVYSSSSSAYGETPKLPKVETDAPAPLSPYAVSKLAAEHYCTCFAKVYGLATVSLRYFNVFGPRQDPNSPYAAVIPAFLSRMVRGQRPVIFGDGEQSRDFCYIDNVVAANRLAARAEGLSGEAVNIACGERTTLNAIVRTINELLGARLEPEYREPRPGDVRHSLADIDAARRVLGYRPQVMFGDGLRRTLEWYRQDPD